MVPPLTAETFVVVVEAVVTTGLLRRSPAISSCTRHCHTSAAVVTCSNRLACGGAAIISRLLAVYVALTRSRVTTCTRAPRSRGLSVSVTDTGQRFVRGRRSSATWSSCVSCSPGAGRLRRAVRDESSAPIRRACARRCFGDRPAASFVSGGSATARRPSLRGCFPPFSSFRV